jgi:2-polyprenyl-6-methoxyphenol hydroxylase-like FAD-dependent oxidoreductase
MRTGGRSNDSVVIVGGSFAGLVTARVLSEEFSEVIIIERDDLPDALINRKGVPQTPHVHGVQQLGRQILDDLFPGFVAGSEREGAEVFDQLEEIAIFNGAGWTARGKSSVKGYGIRRALLEQLLRRRVLAIPNVSVQRGAVEGLQVSSDGNDVVGVLFDGDGSEGRIGADLVVDASGRGSAAPRWLEAIGYPSPEDEIVNGFVGYASQLLQVPDGVWPGDMRGIAQLPFPGQTRGGILYPQDNGLHVMSLFGQARDYPPSDPDGFLEFVSTCGTPLMHEVLTRSQPVSDIFTSRSTANRLRHNEALARTPGGFVVIGDAAAVFNPIFGQGSPPPVGPPCSCRRRCIKRTANWARSLACSTRSWPRRWSSRGRMPSEPISVFLRQSGNSVPHELLRPRWGTWALTWPCSWNSPPPISGWLRRS